MRIRLKTKWNKQEREVSLGDTVSVLAFNTWKIGMQTLVEIENENFQTDTQMQRVMIMEEIMAFMIHVLDRIAHTRFDLGDEDAQQEPAGQADNQEIAEENARPELHGAVARA